MESIEKEKKGKLDTRDLITLGIFIAIIIVIYMVVAMLTHLFPPPVHQWFSCAITVLVSGPIYILMCIKIQKKGIYLINGVIQGIILILLFGMWWVIIFYVLGGVLAELIFLKSQGGYSHKKNNVFGYITFQSVSQFGNYVVYYFFAGVFIDMMVNIYAGDRLVWEGYIEMFYQPWSALILITSLIICSVIGAFIGLKIYAKHFEKAGIV